MKNNVLIIFILLFVIAGVYYMFTLQNTEIKNTVQKEEVRNVEKNGQKITVYKSPQCGCCVTYAEELEKEGYEVETLVVENMSTIKEKYKIPREMESCHTSVIDNYFIEGHVPFSVLKKLLEEKPDIDGVALPNMPSGTPGMPGIKKGQWEIYQMIDGEFSPYLTI